MLLHQPSISFASSFHVTCSRLSLSFLISNNRSLGCCSMATLRSFCSFKPSVPWISRRDGCRRALDLRSTPDRRRPSGLVLSAVVSANVVGDLVVRTGEYLPEDYGTHFPAREEGKRRAGVLLHPSSLPGPYGIGDLGEEAIRFLDWLHSAGCSVWQVCSLSLIHLNNFLDFRVMLSLWSTIMVTFG